MDDGSAEKSIRQQQAHAEQSLTLEGIGTSAPTVRTAEASVSLPDHPRLPGRQDPGSAS